MKFVIKSVLVFIFGSLVSCRSGLSPTPLWHDVAILGQDPAYKEQPVVLRFQPKITKNATKLGDLLIISDKTLDWEKIPLDSHPTPGDIITSTKIMEWMTQHIGHFHVIWHGKTHITIKQSTQASEKMLIAKAKMALLHQLNPLYLRVTVTPLSHLNGSEYAIDEFKTKLNLTTPTATRVCVWLVNKKTKIAVWFSVHAYANVLVANRDLHSNRLLQTDDFSWQERNIAGLNFSPAAALLPHTWLTSPIKKNAILNADQFKTVPLIVHGQHIKVATHNHSITVVMHATALADGYLGDTITVKNPLNQKTFVVKITGDQCAEVAS